MSFHGKQRSTDERVKSTVPSTTSTSKSKKDKQKPALKIDLKGLSNKQKPDKVDDSEDFMEIGAPPTPNTDVQEHQKHIFYVDLLFCCFDVCLHFEQKFAKSREFNTHRSQ